MMDDLIYRQAAINAVMDEFKRVPTTAIRAKKRLEGLPSAQPQRMRGRWIYNSRFTMKCDQCGIVIKDWDWFRFKICPGCGADMREGKDG